jgi:serine/threonine protein phosphatase 1
MIDEINNKRPRTFVIGDIHGNYKALKQILEHSNFDYDNDTLIQLGDVVDGWSETYECVEELLKIKHLISIKGNHDEWFNQYLIYGIHPDGWRQGGYMTAKSYLKQIGKEDMIEKKLSGGYMCALNPYDVPPSHHEFFRTQQVYHIDYQNRLFVHGGFNRHVPFERQVSEHIYYWDRDLWGSALSFQSMKGTSDNGKPLQFKMKNNFNEIYIGHTATIFWDTDIPMKAANIWNLDTGAGAHRGKLTIMDIDTKEYWQSDISIDLYPDEKGRGF